MAQGQTIHNRDRINERARRRAEERRIKRLAAEEFARLQAEAAENTPEPAPPPPPDEPSGPEVPPVQTPPGYPPSGTPPGTEVSELTPRPNLPAFVPNFSNIFGVLNQPRGAQAGQPTYVDPSYYFRAEDPYPGPIDYSQYWGGIGGSQTGRAPFPPVDSMQMGNTFQPQKPISMGIGGGGFPNMGSMTTGMSNPMMSGNTFGQFAPNSAIGGGMLGSQARGFSPRTIGGMLSRNYFG